MLDRNLIKTWISSWQEKDNLYRKIIPEIEDFSEKFVISFEENDIESAFEYGSILGREIEEQHQYRTSDIIEAWNLFEASLIKILEKENIPFDLIEKVEYFFNKSKTGFLEELLKRERLYLEGAKQREKELSTETEITGYELSIALSKKVSLKEAMDLTLETVNRLIGAERSSIMLWDSEEKTLSVKAARGIDATPFGLAKIKSGEGIAGWCFEQGKTRVVNDVNKDENFVKSPSNQQEIKSIICLPLISEDQKTGVINVGTLSRYHTFTRDEIKTLELIASRAALVIDNVMLREKEERYLKELKEKTDKLNAIVNYMGDGVLTFNEKEEITFFNKAAEYITELKEEDVSGKLWPEVIEIKDEKGKKVDIEPSFKFKKSKGFFNISREETKFLSAIATPLITPQGKKAGGIVVFSDMSKEKEIEKMKSEFVSIVSHDLRSPLTSVKGYASMLLHYRNRLDDEKQIEFLEIIIREIDRLVRLIKTLLDLGKIESGRFDIQKGEVDLASIINNVVITYRSSEEHNIKINIPAPLPVVIGDPDQLEQVMHNLVGNAIKYSPDGGVVEIGAIVQDKLLKVYVQDEGIGIPEEERDGIFDKFKRIKTGRKIVGAGLGLFITKNIIDAHEGTIRVESPEKGTRFMFSLNL